MAKPKYQIRETIKETEKVFEPERKFLGLWFAIPFFAPKKFSTLAEAERFIQYYEMIRTKTDVKFHPVETIDQYEPLPPREDGTLF